jgi:anhydro-N-acetylmuramic acid kinase
MSGTSLDGIDAAACRFEEGSTSIGLVSEVSLAWPPAVRELLLQLASESKADINTLTRAHFALPYYYGEVVKLALDEAGLSTSDVRGIGLHGQTIRHLPTPESLFPGSPAVGATLQLGSGPALAALTGIDVVHDFRSADVALGGQGAPLVPMFDYQFLRSNSANRVALNIGGIANITWLPKNNGAIQAFDCGPGNMIIDALTRAYFDRPYDENGEIARGGTVNDRLLDELLRHDYFHAPPPKSTGRELFGAEFFSRISSAVDAKTLAREDAVATATELTTRSIANAVRDISTERCEILASGGGARNKFLLERLDALLPDAHVETTETVGIPVQSKEAIAFAYFAFAYVYDLHIHLPHTTGASRVTTLGSLARGR